MPIFGAHVHQCRSHGKCASRELLHESFFWGSNDETVQILQMSTREIGGNRHNNCALPVFCRFSSFPRKMRALPGHFLAIVAQDHNDNGMQTRYHGGMLS